MTWFREITGFDEVSPLNVSRNMRVDGETLTSLANGRIMACGRLETPYLSDLRGRVQVQGRTGGKLSLREVVADVQDLHADASNAGAFFQVASQFNLLEMTSPYAAPEDGISDYEHDHTQGPACAIAAGAGTIYRNYFVPVNGRIGQTADNQIDCLANLGAALGNACNRLWVMQSGYALAYRDGLVEIARKLGECGEDERDALRRQLRIGVQWNTQVTLNGCTHTVSQAYCSALPVAYSGQPSRLWEPFARLVLEASYEATILAAILNAQETGNNTCYLTMLGGGAFGNEEKWIEDAIWRALTIYADADLDVVIVSYGASNRTVRQLVFHYTYR